jgi:hypothetical protein
MRPYIFIPLGAWWLLWTGGVHAQAIKDPAELMPAKVLAYAELRQPGSLVKEWAGLFEGSHLTRYSEYLAKMDDPGYEVRERWGLLSLLTAPETVNEVQRLQGAAVAITSFDQKEGTPDFLAIVLPGRSNGPGFAMRVALTMGPVNLIGEVEGVKLYQAVKGWAERRPGPPPREARKGMGPALAMTPEVLLIGTPDLVKDAIRRAKGKGQGPALASVAAYQAASKELGSKPGLFLYEDVAAIMAMVEPLAVDQMGVELWKVVQSLVNPKAFQSVAAAWTLEQGTMIYRVVVRLNPGEQSPLLEVRPSVPLKTDLLRFAPKDALLVAGVANTDGEKRLARLLSQADEVIKAQGKGDTLPSYYLEQFETLVLHAKVGKDLLGKVAAAGFALGDPCAAVGGKPPKDPPFVVLVQATSEADAKFLLTDMAPKILSMALGLRDLKPVEKTVEGQSILTLGKENRGYVHYGRYQDMLVFGPHQSTVAAALSAGAKGNGFLTNKSVAAAIARVEEPIALVVSRPLPTLLVLMTTVWIEAERRAASASVEDLKGAPPGKRTPPSPDPAKEVKELLTLAEGAGPLVLAITRKPDRIVIEAQQTGLKPMVGKLIDFLMAKDFQRTAAPSETPATPPPLPLPGIKPKDP